MKERRQRTPCVLGDFEFRTHVAQIDSLVWYFPIRTIAAKAQIADALVARGLGPIFLR